MSDALIDCLSLTETKKIGSIEDILKIKSGVSRQMVGVLENKAIE